jgi:DNA mismatch repair protein MutL
VKSVFAVHALAHPRIGFSLVVDGRELYNLAPAGDLSDRVRDLFGAEFLEAMLAFGEPGEGAKVRVSGFIERPNLSMPTRREQYVFVNGRPATAPSIAYAMREAYPRRPGDVRPAAVVFIDLPPGMVDVNVHPTKREVRFRDNAAVKAALADAIMRALSVRPPVPAPAVEAFPPRAEAKIEQPVQELLPPSGLPPAAERLPLPESSPPAEPLPLPEPSPVQNEIVFADEPDCQRARPWQWFKYLAQSASGYLLVETDAGIVTVNPIAARERISYEKIVYGAASCASEALLVPETVKFGPVEAARVSSALEAVRAAGFQIEPFGTDTFKIDAVPQVIGELSPSGVLATIAHDLSAGGAKRSGLRWREELIAKSIARSFAGASLLMTEEGAVKLIEELCACRMPYVCPRGKPVMIFTSTRELDRKFGR